MILFRVCYSSTIFIHAWELRPLSPHFAYRIMRLSFWLKSVVLLLEASISLLFVVLLFKGINDIAAILEWIMGFVFTVYIASLGIDNLYSRRLIIASSPAAGMGN